MTKVSPLQKITSDAVLAALQARPGKQNAVSGAALTKALCGESRPYLVRRLREVVATLRDRGWPICAKPEHGYWWAANADELVAVGEYHRCRALASLRQVSRQKRYGIPVLEGQGHLFDPELSDPSQLEQPNPVPDLLVSEVPEALHEALTQWLDEHPGWDMNRVATASLALLLMQQGDEAAARIYLDTLFEEAPDDLERI